MMLARRPGTWVAEQEKLDRRELLHDGEPHSKPPSRHGWDLRTHTHAEDGIHSISQSVIQPRFFAFCDVRTA